VWIESATLDEFSNNIINYIAGTTGNKGGTGGYGGSGGVGGVGGAGVNTYVKGGAGGRGGDAGVSGNGGNGGNGSSVYGLYMNNANYTDIVGNTISSITSGAGNTGGNGGSSAGGSVRYGGKGGNVGVYPDITNVNVKGGQGGVGSRGGYGGVGGSAGFAYGLLSVGQWNDVTLVNNMVVNISALAGATGGNGGSGTPGGAGGNGLTNPGGDGGRGGAAGSGGDGGYNGGGVINASGIAMNKQGSISAATVTATNNTIATVKSTDSEPIGGTAGTPGTGGIGGTGDPDGRTAADGATGSPGYAGWQGYASGYYSGEKIASSLYNNIVVSFESPTPTNAIGLYKLISGSFDRFLYGNVWGWHINYHANLAGIDSTGSITQNPLMLDPTHATTPNFRLQSASPCINTASNTAPATPGVDRDGVPRPLPAGGTVDMGAYEWGSYYRFSQASMSVGEGDGILAITIQQVGYLETAGQVSFTFTNGSATNGQDFNYGNSMVSFSSGTVNGIRTLEVPIYEDALIEGPETFQVTLNTPVGGVLMDPSVVTVTIIDNDAFWIFLPLIIR